LDAGKAIYNIMDNEIVSPVNEAAFCLVNAEIEIKTLMKFLIRHFMNPFWDGESGQHTDGKRRRQGMGGRARGDF
jgi:hypothetical protein